MKKVIFNEDSNHFIYSRMKAGYSEITKQDLKDFILQYKDTCITDFVLCVGSSVPWYPSSRFKSILTYYQEWMQSGKSHLYEGKESQCAFSSIRLLSEYYEAYGKTFYDIWIPTLREIGISPWISIRMNDIHECAQEDSILFSDFYRENRSLNRASHRGAFGYLDYALDYMHESVRAYYLAVVEDALETFDTDGIELDWMREIYSLEIGREFEGIGVINTLMRDVYDMVKRAEKKRGHAIRIAVRMPDSPEKALRLGFDVFDWVEHGLVDRIVVTSRWSSVDNDMPIDVWKRIFSGKPVEIAAGLEILVDAYNRRGRKYCHNTFESAIGSVCANLWQGADAIYLFNYMDMPDPEQGDSVLFGKRYREFLSTIGDYQKCVSKKRCHIVTFDDVDAVGLHGKKQLPIRLFGNGEPQTFQTLRLVTGDIPKGRRVYVVLGVAAGADISGESLLVWLSARKCTFLEERKARGQQYEDMRYFVYTPENDEELPPVSVIEAGLTKGDLILHWAEIEID